MISADGLGHKAEFGDDAEAAVAKITAFIHSQPANIQTKVPSPGMALHPPLRSKEFWALVLAQLQQRPLIIMAYVISDNYNPPGE